MKVKYCRHLIIRLPVNVNFYPSGVDEFVLKNGEVNVLVKKALYCWVSAEKTILLCKCFSCNIIYFWKMVAEWGRQASPPSPVWSALSGFIQSQKWPFVAFVFSNLTFYNLVYAYISQTIYNVLKHSVIFLCVFVSVLVLDEVVLMLWSIVFGTP